MCLYIHVCVYVCVYSCICVYSCVCVSIQGGKDYIPLTDGELQGSLTSDPSRPYVKALRDATLDPQVHYDNAPSLGLVPPDSHKPSG